MKAIRVDGPGGPEVMTLEEVPDPRPGPGQVLVRVHAAGVNPVDTYIRAGSYGALTYPYTPGADGAGTVEAVGEGVTRFKKGDRIYLAGSATGTYAELSLAAESQVHPLPEKLSFQQGAAVNIPYATAYRALHLRGRAEPGEYLLVHGATGGVGIAAVQIARAIGMVVIGTGGTEEGRELAREQGAHHVLDHHADGYLQEVVKIASGQGVNIILELLANVNLGKDLTALAPGGRVVVVGSRGTVEIDPRATMGRDLSILGMSLGNASPKELTGIHSALFAGLENGILRPIIRAEIPLAEAARAHKEIMAPGASGKIVLIP